MKSKVRFTRVKEGYDFRKASDRAREGLGYYQEGILVETAARIQDAMEREGVNRVELARRLGTSPAYVTKILRGHANLTLETLAKIAFALNMKWECILIPRKSEISVFILSDETGSARVSLKREEPAAKERMRKKSAEKTRTRSTSRSKKQRA